MTDRPSDRAIAHLARIAVSHLDDGANCNITPGLNAALRRLREELDKTNAGYAAAAPEGAQPSDWRLTDRFGRVSHTRDKADAELFAGLDSFKVEPLFEHPAQPSLGGEEVAENIRLAYIAGYMQGGYDYTNERLDGMDLRIEAEKRAQRDGYGAARAIDAARAAERKTP